MQYASYQEIISMIPAVKPVVPGRRVYFRLEDFFAVWIQQHQRRLLELTFANEGMSYLDRAMDAFAYYPEVVENGDPGGG